MSDSTSRLYTLDDLWDFPDDGQRRELIDGVLYVTAAARTRHQWVVGYLTYIFWDWIEHHGGQVFPGCNVDFAPDTHFEPDIAFLRPGREVGDVLSLLEPPDLVVEVSSPSTKRYDLGIKPIDVTKEAFGFQLFNKFVEFLPIHRPPFVVSSSNSAIIGSASANRFIVSFASSNGGKSELSVRRYS